MRRARMGGLTGLALTTRKAGTTRTVTPRKVSVSKPRSLITSTAVAISTPTPARTRNAARRRLPVAVSPVPRRGRDAGLPLPRRRGGCRTQTDAAVVGIMLEEDPQRQRAGKRAACAATAMAPGQASASCFAAACGRRRRGRACVVRCARAGTRELSGGRKKKKIRGKLRRAERRAGCPPPLVAVARRPRSGYTAVLHASPATDILPRL
jgi:hypothetical protein